MAQKTIFELDLLAITRHRAHANIVAFFMFALFIAWIVAAATMPPNNVALVGTVLWLIYLGMAVWAVVVMVLLQIACGSSPFTTVIFAIITLFFGFLAMIAAASQASTILRLAGAKVGFLGVSKSEREKITPGHCRGCGYDRTGLKLLQECPECTRVPQVI